MICPYCKQEMLLGYIPNAQQPVQWLPEGKKPSPFSFSTSDDGIELKNSFKPFKLNGYVAEAYYCPNCKIVIAKAKG